MNRINPYVVFVTMGTIGDKTPWFVKMRVEIDDTVGETPLTVVHSMRSEWAKEKGVPVTEVCYKIYVNKDTDNAFIKSTNAE